MTRYYRTEIVLVESMAVAYRLEKDLAPGKGAHKVRRELAWYRWTSVLSLV